MGNSLNLRIHIAVELSSNALNLSFASIFFTPVFRKYIHETNIGELYYFINHESRYPANGLGRLCLDRVALTLTFKYIAPWNLKSVSVNIPPLFEGGSRVCRWCARRGAKTSFAPLQTVSDI